MNQFIHENFLLQSKAAQRLYHDYVAGLPIIDYHCHLQPSAIASNTGFTDISQAWLDGDHYKWRAMRANGVDEKFITGKAAPFDKFDKWAETLPFTVRNPLYHWSQLELKRYFGIDDLLNPKNAHSLFGRCNELIQNDKFTTQSLLRKFSVETVCTTDSPLSDLQHHRIMSASETQIQMLPTFRPDLFFDIKMASSWNSDIDRLAEIQDEEISSYQEFLDAVDRRVSFFDSCGCRMSDHGFESIFHGDYSEDSARIAFAKARQGKQITTQEVGAFHTHLLLHLCTHYARLGWTQQFHLGALRNANPSKLSELGPDTGFDSIGDFPQAANLQILLSKLEGEHALAKTILYNLNPADNEVFATMAGNFQGGGIKGKIQYGSGWWFLDQKDGIERQINAISNMGLVSRFIGMLTDSRSFLSFPRHEYFRRIVCNIFAQDVEAGLIPEDYEWLGGILRGIAYQNAKDYFNFQTVNSFNAHA